MSFIVGVIGAVLALVVLFFVVVLFLGFLNIKRYADIYEIDYEEAARQLAARARARRDALRRQDTI